MNHMVSGRTDRHAIHRIHYVTRSAASHPRACGARWYHQEPAQIRCSRTGPARLPSHPRPACATLPSASPPVAASCPMPLPVMSPKESPTQDATLRPGPRTRPAHPARARQACTSQPHAPGPRTRPTHQAHAPGPCTRPTHQAHAPKGGLERVGTGGPDRVGALRIARVHGRRRRIFRRAQDVHLLRPQLCGDVLLRLASVDTPQSCWREARLARHPIAAPAARRGVGTQHAVAHVRRNRESVRCNK